VSRPVLPSPSHSLFDQARLKGDPAWEMHVRGAREIVALLKDVERWIPPFRAVFSPHDNPNLLASWRLREEAKRAVQEDRCVSASPSPFLCARHLTFCSPRRPRRQRPAAARQHRLALRLRTDLARVRGARRIPAAGRLVRDITHSFGCVRDVIQKMAKGPVRTEPVWVVRKRCASPARHDEK
jgi:hypothetical protein